MRGDTNGDGTVDISDPVSSLGYLFLGTFVPTCLDAADVDDDGTVQITDAIHALSFLFVGGEPPAGPYPACAADPTPDDGLSCSSFESPTCGLPESRILEILAVLGLAPTEPCCFPGLGTYPVLAGRCESLGGVPLGPPAVAGVPAAAADDACPPDTAPEPGLEWAATPPVTLLDETFTVAILSLDLPADVGLLTLDLYLLDEFGDTIGPVRIASMSAAPGEIDLSVSAAEFPMGSFSLRATAWRLAEEAGDEIVQSIGGEESRPEPPVMDAPVAILDLPAPLRVGPTRAATLSTAGVAAILAEGPDLDPLMDLLAADVGTAEAALRAVEATISSPLIDDLRGRIRDRESDRSAAEREAAEARARLEELREMIAGLQRALEALRLVNRYLDSYFGPADLARIAEQIRRREGILAGAGVDDRKELESALAAKETRLPEVEQALPAAQADCSALRSEHAALKDAIRAQFHKTRRTLGDNMGKIQIDDDGVDYDITGLLVVDGGNRVLKYAPHGKAYEEEKKKLDEMIRQLEDLWRRIQECERGALALETERTQLAENIERLDRAAGEVEETEALLDEYYRRALGGDAPHAPHLRDLIARLRALGESWLADLLEDLLGQPPRTSEELEDFRNKLEALREAKHAREAELEDEIAELEEAAAEEERKVSEADERRKAAEDEGRALEEELRRAEEEARRAAEEEYRRAQAAAEQEAARRKAERELEDRLRELRDRAREGDEEALKELAKLIGLGLLDELVEDLPLGTLIGGALTAAETPECLCDILEALVALFAAQRGQFRLPYADEVIRRFRECAGVDWFAGTELGSEEMARAVDRMPDAKRLRVVAAMKRAQKLNDCP